MDKQTKIFQEHYDAIEGAESMTALQTAHKGLTSFLSSQETKSIRLNAVFFLKVREIAHREGLNQTQVRERLGLKSKGYVSEIYSAQTNSHTDVSTGETVDYLTAIERGLINVDGRDRVTKASGDGNGDPIAPIDTFRKKVAAVTGMLLNDKKFTVEERETFKTALREGLHAFLPLEPIEGYTPEPVVEAGAEASEASEVEDVDVTVPASRPLEGPEAEASA